MLEQTLLGGLVVIGHHLQLAIGAHVFGTPGQFDGLGCRVGPTTGHDGDAPLGLLDADPDDVQMLLHADGGGFAGGADRHNAIGALVHMPIHQTAQTWVVDGAVLKHGGGQGHNAASDADHVQVSVREKRSFYRERVTHRVCVVEPGLHGHHPLYKSRRGVDKTIFVGHDVQASAHVQQLPMAE